MTILELISMMQARVARLQQDLTMAQSAGDLAQTVALEADLTQTQATVHRLQALI